GVVLSVLLLTACGVQPEPPATPTETPTFQPTPQPTPTATPTPPPTFTPTPTAIPGPFESQPAIPYPSDEIVQGLGITRYQVVGDQYVALNDEGYIVAQAITKENGEFDKWQRTLPFDVETHLVVPHPQETNPELLDLKKSDAPIPQFVNAMEMGGIEVTAEQVSQGITYVDKKDDGTPYIDKDGNPFVVAVYNIPVQFFNKEYQFLAGDYPLLIARQKDGQWQWNRFFYPDAGTIIGIDTSALFDGSDSVELLKNNAIIRSNFTFATIPYSYGSDIIGNKKDVLYRLDGARISGFSGSIMVHVLDVDYILSQNPTSKDQVLDLIRQQLEYASKLFKDARIFVIWNEIHPPAGHPPYDLFRKFGGIDLVVDTYRMAKQILGKEAVLLYNETYNYSFREGFYPQTKKIVERLSQESLIDGVGMQMHIFQYGNEIEPNEEEITQVMKNYGIPVYYTEFDINQVYLSNSNKDLKQAQEAYIITRACARSGVCKMIGFWGVYDGNTWLEYSLNLSSTKPLPFDKNGNPKLFYYAVLKALFDSFKQ
ncbi:MAG: endo-1,4-beta-xylanase, partial [bacterium]